MSPFLILIGIGLFWCSLGGVGILIGLIIIVPTVWIGVMGSIIILIEEWRR